MSSNAVVGSSKSAVPTSTAATASPPHSSSIDDADHHNHSHGHVTTTTTITSPTSQTPAKVKTISSESSRRAKELFGDCALVEIIHLHDCFRGALRTLENDVSELCRAIDGADVPGPVHGASNETKWNDLERRIAGRFTVIWSVFRAHSAAEDEFIWPALKAKQVALPEGGECDSHCGGSRGSEEGIAAGGGEGGAGGVVGIRDVVIDDGGQPLQARERLNSTTVHCIEQEEYEEDHADEERMFLAINDLMSKLREELVMFQRNEAEGNSHSRNNRGVDETGRETADDAVHPNKSSHMSSLQRVAKLLLDGTRNLMRHLMVHLDKEETHCMPLVAQYLTKSEIHDLIGKIMGKRSSELMSQILTMAVQNLDDSDRDDMVGYMKQAMVGTFFERWLKMGGWINSQHGSAAGDDDVAAGDTKDEEEEEEDGRKPPFQRDQNEIAAEVTSVEKDAANDDIGVTAGDDKMERDCCCNRADDTKRAANSAAATTSSTAAATASDSIASAQAQGAPTHNANQNNHYHNNNNLEEPTNGNYTSAAELEKLIRAIGTNPNLDTKQKNLTIQGLRDSVWKSNCRLSKRKREEWEDETSTAAMEHTGTQASHFSGDEGNPDRSMVPTGGMVSQPTHHLSFAGARTSASVGTRFKRETPPSSYYKKNKEGDVQLAWKHDPHSTSSNAMEASVPLFSAAELAPTYHDGGINRVLGCPHYARSCKLRHPTSGRLYTCRLCCEQDREMATKDKDSPLDRYEVKEILCMICGALQPAGKHCVNPECASEGKPFARYSCGICNFYDNSPDKAIYHCPFCNVCRSGRGLGIDYRHCMRCNACVSLTDDHHCIPQRLQANCPICHETMFQSTEPLRGLQCGHVMHLNCFTMYMRGGNYTCPLCKKSAEDMTEYFALLDSAIRMQPMPPAYAATTSNIYCQDCGKMGNVSYHFVGLKCQHCGSFNTRELQRVDPNIMASLWQGY